MKTLHVADIAPWRGEIVRSIFRDCTPRILVYTDLGGGYDDNEGFSLSQFVHTLENTSIRGMNPEVRKAHRSAGPGADLPNYSFATGSNGNDALDINRFDALFIFGIGSGRSIPQNEVDAIARFMQAGGGVFATGDHATLGAAICENIPRVRNMRLWRAGTPSAGGTDRISTNLAGDDEIHQFADQSDRHPQRIYLNFRTLAGGIDEPHPLMQGKLGPIEEIADHPHEGECVIPDDLTTKFQLGQNEVEEWPLSFWPRGRLRPEVVALSMSHGDAFPGKASLEPRSFIAIAAYDGHRARVGRVVTDATWHHFVNINIDGTDAAGREGLRPGGTDSPALTKIREHWSNLANWLMPVKKRQCLRWPWIIQLLQRYPLVELVQVVHPDQEDAGEAYRRLGSDVDAAIVASHRRFEVESLIEDALAAALGSEERAVTLLQTATDCGRLSGRQLGLAALGGSVSGLVQILAQEELTEKTRAERLEKAAIEGARRAFALARGRQRERLAELDRAIEGLSQPETD